MNSSTIQPDRIPYAWIRKELAITGAIQRASTGKTVEGLQEWLTLNGIGLAIDGKFGPATETALRRYQEMNRLPATGQCDPETYRALTAPMLRALTPPADPPATYRELVVSLARQHLQEHPREVGGNNRGPWVRLYMSGKEGTDWPWCAGFVSFLLRQAAGIRSESLPLLTSVSCNELAANARKKSIFVSESDLARGASSKGELLPGSIFLIRTTSADWNHTGIVISFQEENIETIEGNTNDRGHREGYEVCRRFRGYKNKDFIRI